jgi:hypothetical protein
MVSKIEEQKIKDRAKEVTNAGIFLANFLQQALQQVHFLAHFVHGKHNLEQHDFIHLLERYATQSISNPSVVGGE